MFASIQGESSYVGLPCFFIRLTGCNLRCVYCDTRYAYYEGTEMPIDHIIDEAKRAGNNLVEVTGGEPLIQRNSKKLIESLCNEGFRVLVETNGSENIKAIDQRAVTILDLKTPGSGMSGKMDFKNINRLGPQDEIKFVITDRKDYEWTRKILDEYQLYDENILLSPARGYLTERELACWIIEDRLDVRLNLQIHKYIFGDNRGV